jgi:hypothetical protein
MLEDACQVPTMIVPNGTKVADKFTPECYASVLKKLSVLYERRS